MSSGRMLNQAEFLLVEDIPLAKFEKKENKRQSHRHFKHRGKRKRTDFILAAKNEIDHEKELKLQTYFRILKKKRLKISESLLSSDGKTMFWLIHAPFDILCDVAEDLNIRLPTRENDIEVTVWYDKVLSRFTKWWDDVDPFRIHDSHFPKPKCYFAIKFDKNRINEFLYGNKPDKLFTQTERSRLVSYILEDTCFDYENPTNIGKSTLIEEGVLTAAYPCHDGPLREDPKNPCVNTRQKLGEEWGSFRKIFKYQPIDAIMEYFGVKVAFYYAWVGFYTAFLVPAALVGFFCFMYGCFANISYTPLDEICYPRNETSYYMCPLCDRLCTYRLLIDTCLYARFTLLFDNDFTVFFAVFMSIWSIIYLEYWKRQQWFLSYNWHTMEFYEEEVVRPQFRAATKRLKPNQVTGKLEPNISRKDHFVKLAGEFSVVLFFITLVIAALIGVIIYRAAIYGVLATAGGSLRGNSKIFITSTAALINLVVINILKLVYRKLAVMMTEWENPRTRTAYEKSFTIKMFWFQFCNTYASVFYVAFFKSEFFIGYPGKYRRFGTSKYRLEGCSAQGCFLELCVQLIILMVGQQFFGNIAEILLPYVRKRYNAWKNDVKNSRDVPVFEADYQLLDQDQLSLFWEYQEVALQYGFVTMFVAAFPLAPLIALVTNLVELRIDAINMITFFRRPVAYKAEGIGVWYDILATLTALGVLVNGFVLAITSEFIPRTIYQYQFSPDGTLKGYVNWSLSTYNVSYFQDVEKPLNPTEYVPVQQPICRYSGFHEPIFPFSYTAVHWEIMSMRLIFAFLFQWLVTAITRVISWVIPDRPKTLDLKIKREEFLAQEALRKYKIQTGKRKATKNDSASEDDSGDDSATEPSSSQDDLTRINVMRHRPKPRSASKDSALSKQSKQSRTGRNLVTNVHHPLHHSYDSSQYIGSNENRVNQLVDTNLIGNQSNGSSNQHLGPIESESANLLATGGNNVVKLNDQRLDTNENCPDQLVNEDSNEQLDPTDSESVELLVAEINSTESVDRHSKTSLNSQPLNVPSEVSIEDNLNDQEMIQSPDHAIIDIEPSTSEGNVKTTDKKHRSKPRNKEKRKHKHGKPRRHKRKPRAEQTNENSTEQNNDQLFDSGENSNQTISPEESDKLLPTEENTGMNINNSADVAVDGKDEILSDENIDSREHSLSPELPDVNIKPEAASGTPVVEPTPPMSPTTAYNYISQML